MFKSGPNPEQLYAILSAYQSFTKMREYFVNEDRKPIHESNTVILPILQDLIETILAPETYSLDSFTLLNKALKIYFNVTRMDLDPYTRSIEISDRWMGYLEKILNISDQNYSVKTQAIDNQTTKEKLAKDPFWTTKQSCLNILRKYSTKYGIPENENDEHKKFAEHWVQNCCIKFVGPLNQLVEGAVQGYFIPKKVLSLSVAFFSQITRSKVIRTQ